VSGEVEMDMRDGSPQIVAMKSRASSQKGFESQLRDTRLFLLRHAETKAKLRAIADMGVKRSYTAAELRKPFAVARLMWTGETDDPELKKEAFRMQHEKMVGASSALYGDDDATTPAKLPKFEGHEAPPVGEVADDDGDPGDYVDTTGTPTSGDEVDGDRGDDPDQY